MNPNQNQTQTQEKNKQVEEIVERYKKLAEEMVRYITLYSHNQTQYAYINSQLWFPDEKCVVWPEDNVVVKLHNDVVVVSFPHRPYETYVYRISTVRYIHELLESPHYDIVLKAVKMCADKEEKKRKEYIEIANLLKQTKK